MHTVTKILYAAFKAGKRYTRWRTDKRKTLGIAKKTHTRLSEDCMQKRARSFYPPIIEVRHVKISKLNDRGSFAIIANDVSPL